MHYLQAPSVCYFTFAIAFAIASFFVSNTKGSKSEDAVNGKKWSNTHNMWLNMKVKIMFRTLGVCNGVLSIERPELIILKR